MADSDRTSRALAEGRAFVEHKLRKAWRKERRFHHLRGLCFLLIWAVVLVLVDLLIDWLFLASYGMPGWSRLLLVGLNAATLLVVLHHYWWRFLRGYDPVRVALEFERKHPELKSLLVSFVQITDEAREQTHASPALVLALRRQAVAATRPLNFKEVISYRLLARLLEFSLVLTGLFAGIAAYKTDFFATLLHRILNPTSSREYPTRTVIERVTGDLSVQQGTSLTISATCSGEVPASGTLTVQADDGPAEALTFLPARGSVFAYRFNEVRRSFRYTIRLGDDESDTFRIDVVPAPKIVEKRIGLEFPAHMHRKAETHDSYYIEVPEGTKVTWWLRCDRPVSSALMVRNGRDPNELTIRDGGHVVEYTTVAWKSFDYRFRWKLLAHPEFIYDTAGAYAVNVTPDVAPMVEIIEPYQDEKATIRKTLSVTFRAADDYGLSEARLVYSVNDGEPSTWRIGPLSGPSVKTSFEKKLTELLSSLKVDDVVTYHVAVSDNRTGERGPNVAQSRPRRVYVVSIEEYLRGILEEQMRWVSEVEELRVEEKQADGEVQTMKKEAQTQPTSQPSNP